MTWPAVFDGIGALVVNCALDPADLVVKINRHSTAPLTWIAFKVGGKDVADDAETRHCAQVWHDSGLAVGAWVYCGGPPTADATEIHNAAVSIFQPIAFAVYDVEAEYKTDAGAPADYPRRLVAAHDAIVWDTLPAAVTSYGAIPGYGNFPSSIDFGAFARAGWPIIAQAYDGFSVPDAVTYTELRGGPYPAAGVHTMVRSLRLVKGQAVFRPEGLDG